MNPFKKRPKSPSGEKRKGRNGKGNDRSNGASNPQPITPTNIALYLPSDRDFRTSLLMPKMADRFSLLRVDEPGQNNRYVDDQSGHHFGMHGRDLSILEEGDEEDENLPVHPWERNGRKERPGAIPAGMSKDEFMRVRAQESNMLFSGKQRTFKFRSEDDNGN